MAKVYLTNERGMVGRADLPDWVNFNEQPPRFFEVVWMDGHGKDFMKSATQTNKVTPITKEVADILRSVRI
jgi:hypothetical protein